MWDEALLTTAGLDRRVDVFHLRLTPAEGDDTCLDAAERERLARFRLESKRIQFVAARSQMRHVLGRYLGIPPAEVAFAYGEHGKPSLPDHPDLEFNLSHSGEAGLLAVTRGTPVGVDIELHKPGRRFAGIAGRFFAEDESAALLALEPDAQPPAFYRAWACKEAYLKAWGTGLSFPSNRFSIDYTNTLHPRLLATSMAGDDGAGWHFVDVRTVVGFAAAVCYRGEPRWLRQFVPAEATSG